MTTKVYGRASAEHEKGVVGEQVRECFEAWPHCACVIVSDWAYRSTIAREECAGGIAVFVPCVWNRVWCVHMDIRTHAYSPDKILYQTNTAWPVDLDDPIWGEVRTLLKAWEVSQALKEGGNGDVHSI